LQHIIVPVTRDSKPLGEQYCFPRHVAFGIRVLAAIDFDDETFFKTDKIKNKILKGNLPAKFELREPAISQQSPHLGFSVPRFATHLLGELADAFGGWPMVWCLRHEPPHPSPHFVRLSPLPQGERGRLPLAGIRYTRIGIST
jgi:hypothetical protein